MLLHDWLLIVANSGMRPTEAKNLLWKYVEFTEIARALVLAKHWPAYRGRSTSEPQGFATRARALVGRAYRRLGAIRPEAEHSSAVYLSNALIPIPVCCRQSVNRRSYLQIELRSHRSTSGQGSID